MRIRTWEFRNFAGVRTPPERWPHEPSVTVHWIPPSNRVRIEGVFGTGDETHQVALQNVVVSGESAIEVVVGVNRLDAEFVIDVSRYVPYEVTLELFESLPDEVTVVHENERGDEMVRQVETNPQ